MDDKEFCQINMIPFIDVMLVLLTIVLTTSTFVASGAIRVDLPKVEGKHAAATNTHVLEISKDGDIFYQGAPVDLTALKKTIARLPRETAFLIKADKSIALQSFVEVLDLVKNSGFSKVSLQTEWTGK